jgi:hypothetical protein
MKKPYVLTPEEVEILQRGMDDPDYITGYWFKPPGAEGWYFDSNFTPEGRWQKTMHDASQPLVMVIGGVGTGKTLGVGMSAVVWCMTTEGFKFLNVAQREWQAKQMFDLILERSQDTPFEKLIWNAPQRPYPKIIIKFKIGNQTYQSSMEFMSVDRDARGIFSWRGDWINVEEAGLLDNLDEIAMNLATRLTGASARGRPFLGRFSMISNPWDTPHLWYLFELAQADPDENLSIVVSTRHNKNVTDEQIKNLLKHIPEDERPRFLDGLRPEGKGNYFSKQSIYKCENLSAGEFIATQVENGTPGYLISEQYGVGIVHMETPPRPLEAYILVGDPGYSNAPARNSPVLQVWDVTNFPQSPMMLKAFWWGSGNGEITPFVNKLLEWKEYYRPLITGIDSTGPQKAFADLINIEYFDPEINPDSNTVAGLDFGGAKKATYLISTRLMIEHQLVSWPKSIAGIRAQLSNYDPQKDRVNRISQDVVAAMSMACYVARVTFNVTYEELMGQDSALDYELQARQNTREQRQPTAERTRRTPRQTEAVYAKNPT